MDSMPPTGRDVIGGIDTHQDLHTAAVVDAAGEVLATQTFATTRAGYRTMLAWFRSYGDLARVGVEATGTYGAGIARHLAAAGIPVRGVTGLDRAARRGRGECRRVPGCRLTPDDERSPPRRCRSPRRLPGRGRRKSGTRRASHGNLPASSRTSAWRAPRRRHRPPLRCAGPGGCRCRR